MEATVGDFLAVKGAVIKEWNGRRSVQTGYLTHVCTNPTDAEYAIPALDDIPEQPKTKAMRLSPKNLVKLSTCLSQANGRKGEE